MKSGSISWFITDGLNYSIPAGAFGRITSSSGSAFSLSNTWANLVY